MRETEEKKRSTIARPAPNPLAGLIGIVQKQRSSQKSPPRLAEQMNDPEARRMMLGVVKTYEKLAKRAEASKVKSSIRYASRPGAPAGSDAGQLGRSSELCFG